jgi:hypothetical protein
VAEGSQLSFNPGLGLKWPGAPHESIQNLTTEAGEHKQYTATFTEKRPEGVVVFSAFVTEYPVGALRGTDPKELLAAHVLASRKDETSRQAIAHGPQKHPGLDVATRSGTRVGRRLVVMAGRRLYEVGVSSTNEELMRGSKVKAFFDSFAVDE